MKKIIILALCIIMTVPTFAQESMQNLKNTISSLSSKEMKGRKQGTEYADKAADYIKSQLTMMGLTIHDYNMDINTFNKKLNQINKEQENLYRQVYGDDYYISVTEEERHAMLNQGDNKTLQSFYVIFNARNNPNKETQIIATNYTGVGVDTIQGHELIKYGTTESAGTAVVIEICRYIKNHEDELNRDVIVLFSGNYEERNTISLFRKDFKHMNFSTIFDILDNLANVKDEEEVPSTTQVSSNLDYSISSNIENGEKILYSVISKDKTNANTTYYEANYNTSTIFVSNVEASESIYDDNIDKIDYEQLNVNLNELERVVMAFNRAKIEKKEVKDKQGNVVDLPYISDDNRSIFGNDYKHRNYFGIQGLIGSNSHYYNSGTMTGKDAFAFGAGLFFRWQPWDIFGFQIGGNYEHINAKRQEGKMHADIVSVPLSVVITTGGKYYAETFFGAGAYYDYYISGKLNGEKLDFDNKFNRNLWGIQFNFGFRVGRIIFNCYGKSSITNTMQSGKKIGNKSAYIELGYRF